MKTYQQYLSEKTLGTEVKQQEEKDLVKKSAEDEEKAKVDMDKEEVVDAEEATDENDDTNLKNYMFFGNLESMKSKIELLLSKDRTAIDGILLDGHDWAEDHVSAATENLTQVTDFLTNELKQKGSGKVPDVMPAAKILMDKEK